MNTYRLFRRSDDGAWHYARADASGLPPFGGVTLCGRPIEPAEVRHVLDELPASRALELCRECRVAAGQGWLALDPVTKPPAVTS